MKANELIKKYYKKYYLEEDRFGRAAIRGSITIIVSFIVFVTIGYF
jgi:hypothetical protein